MLEVRNLSKSFYTGGSEFKAVDNVSFKVADGEIFGLIGQSGAGKSTLIRCLNLLERPERGEIIFNGCNLLELSERELQDKRRDIAMIFQHFNLFSQRNVFANVAFPLKIAGGLSRLEIENRVHELLDFVSLGDKAKAYPSELSGGQKQRVAIARALATGPSLLLSDEGTSALDPETSQNILALLKKVVEERGISVVLITHQMEVARAICDRIAVMEAGKIVEENDVESIFLRPKHARTRAFIRSLQDENGVFDKSVFFSSDNKEAIYRLGFKGSVAYEPVISRLVRHFDLDLTLLAGNINNLRDDRVGYLLVNLNGDERKVQEALVWLRENKVEVEVVE